MAKIFIGDPCYVLPDRIYDEVWGNQLGYSDGCIVEFDADVKNDCGVVYGTVHGTAYGDGYYSGNLSDYGVDSGTLGIFDLSTFDSPKADSELNRLGKVIELVGELEWFDLTYDEGTFTFEWRDKAGHHQEVVKTGVADEDMEDDYDENCGETFQP